MARWVRRSASPPWRDTCGRDRRRSAIGNPALCADGWFRSDHQTYPYGAQFAAVRIDRDTGAVHVERYLIAFDVGRAINPALVRAQIVGGFAQGLGGALYEEFQYSPEGEPLSVTFADYLLPTLREVPAIDVPDPRGRTDLPQSARHQGRGRRRDRRRRRRDRRRRRRRAPKARRDHADPHQTATDRAASPGRPAAALTWMRQRRPCPIRT